MPRVAITPEVVRAYASAQRARADRLVRSKQELESKLSELLVDLDGTAWREQAEDLLASIKPLELLGLRFGEHAEALDERAERAEAILASQRDGRRHAQKARQNSTSSSALAAPETVPAPPVRYPDWGDWDRFDRHWAGDDPRAPDYTHRATLLQGAPLDIVLHGLGLTAERDAYAEATNEQMRALQVALQKVAPATLSSAVSGGVIPATSPHHGAVVAALKTCVSYFPPEKLPKVPIAQINISDGDGRAGFFDPDDFSLTLDAAYLARPDVNLPALVFHEVMHWFHLFGQADYRESIREHYQERTREDDWLEGTDSSPKLCTRCGEKHSFLTKSDDWYDCYAGRVYNGHGDSPSNPHGYEIPTMYFELLALPPEDLVKHWRNPSVRETLLIVLAGLDR